jgi:hypothetical protein
MADAPPQEKSLPRERWRLTRIHNVPLMFSIS